MSKQDIVIFLFHRDLRLEDNVPLQEALDCAKENNSVVLPLFIFTPTQVGIKAVIKSVASVSCLIQSVVELDEDLKKKYKSGLCIMYDETIKALEKIHKKYDIVGLFETSDVTPYAKKRQEEIEKFCKKTDIHYEAIDYLYLYPIGSVLNGSGKTYQKFTPFYNTTKKFEVPKPEGWVKGDFLNSKEVSKISDLNSEDIEGTKILSKAEWDSVKGKQQFGGRKEGLKLLKNIPKDYDKIRDDLSRETSKLSVHLHGGTLSIREVWYATNIESYKRQILWSNFYANIMDSWDELYGHKYGDFHSWLNERPKLTKQQQKDLENWKNGTTEYDMINAAMNQLNKSNYIHNRGRLIVANYLVKTFKIPWQYGSEYFAQKLIDSDYINNNMNWLFIAGGLSFSEAPYRVYNPLRWQERFDKKGEYVKKWLKKEYYYEK